MTQTKDFWTYSKDNKPDDVVEMTAASRLGSVHTRWCNGSGPLVAGTQLNAAP